MDNVLGCHDVDFGAKLQKVELFRKKLEKNMKKVELFRLLFNFYSYLCIVKQRETNNKVKPLKTTAQ